MTKNVRRHRKALWTAAAALAAGCTIAHAGPLAGATQAVYPFVGASGGAAVVSSSHLLQFTVGEGFTGTGISPANTLSMGMIATISYPGRITALTATPGPVDGGIMLSWTAPGSDGTVGTASRYDVRYATDSTAAPYLSEMLFSLANSASAFGVVPAPAAAGSAQSLLLTGLQTGTTYFFAIKTADAGDSWAFVSAGTGVVAQLIPPAAVTDLTAAPGNLGRQLTLSWTAPGNDGGIGDIAGGAYRIRCSTWTDGTPAFWNTGTWDSHPNRFEVLIATSVSPRTPQQYTLSGLRDTVTYYISLRTCDSHPDNWSDWSNVATGYAEPPLISVTISTGAYNFGGLPPGASTITAFGVLVLNTGNVLQTYSLRCATATPGTPWTAAGSPGTDTFTLQAVFHGTYPGDVFGPEDIVWSTATVAATNTVFSVDGTETGVAVPPAASRTWWLRLQTPLDTSTTAQQRIRTYIVAEETP